MIYWDDSDADSQSNGQAAAEQDDNSQGASNSQDAHPQSGGASS